MNNLIQLSKEFKKLGLHDEKFELSFLLAKIAAQQLELWPVDERVYNCAVCGKPTEFYDATFRDEDEILGRNIKLQYEADKGVYPVCSDCEEEHIKLPCAICENEIDTGEETEVTLEMLEAADIVPPYRLPDDEMYHVCDDCYYEELYESCADCSEFSIKGELEHYNSNNEKICSDCSQNYISCEECGGLIDMENDMWHSDPDYGSAYCEDCGMPSINDFGSMDNSLDKIQRESPYNPDSYMPLTAHTISKTLGLLTNLYKKYQGRPVAPAKASRNFLNTVMNQKVPDADKDFLKEFLIAKFSSEKLREYIANNNIDIANLDDRKKIVNWMMPFGFEAGSAELIIRALEESDDRLIRELSSSKIDPNRQLIDIEKVKQIIDHDQYRREFLNQFSLEFAPVKGLKAMKGFSPMDVTFDVVAPRDTEKVRSFVVVMRPSKEMIENAKLIFGDPGKIAWDMMSSRGTYHFSGAIAYARIGNNDGEWVIDNLQKDADIFNFGKQRDSLNSSYTPEVAEEVEKAAKWWEKQTKNWAAQMLLVLREFAKKSGAELYLTTFEQQKEKWSTLPERNKDIYDKLPKELSIMRQKAQELAGIPEEDREPFPSMVEYKGDIEDVNSWNSTEELWRLAARIRRLVKLARIPSE
jgi:hypothetical protein